MFCLSLFLIASERVLASAKMDSDEARAGNKREGGRVKRRNNPRLSVLKPNAFITSEPPYPPTKQTQRSLLPTSTTTSVLLEHVLVRSGLKFLLSSYLQFISTLFSDDSRAYHATRNEITARRNY